MTDFLMQWGHWGFITLAYALWLLLTAIDGLLPYFKARRLRREIIEQRRREAHRRNA